MDDTVRALDVCGYDVSFVDLYVAAIYCDINALTIDSLSSFETDDLLSQNLA